MAGFRTVGSSRLFFPPSMIRMERSGSARARRPAITHAAVPPEGRAQYQEAMGNMNGLYLRQ